jgi:hypothetical protein
MHSRLGSGHRLTVALAAALAMALAAALTGCSDDATSPDRSPSPFSPAVASTGNGAPSGEHYTLNIIGVSNGKNANMDAASGHVIFVGLGSKKPAEPVTTKIMLSQSASAGEFGVLDKNGTDGVAQFSLPAPGTYSIWARALGTPGGEAKITTCAEDIADDLDGGAQYPIDICSTQYEAFVRGTKADQFRDVTFNLTHIMLADGSDPALACGTTEVSLFNPCLEGYFWKYDNNGLKLLQVRFYYNQ